MWKKKLPLLFTSMVICLVLVLSGCTPKIYQLSTSVTPSGGGTVSPSGGPFSGKVTLVATPAQNYEFSGWAGVASGNTNPLTLTMDSDKQIVAQFKRLQSTVQVSSNPSDGGTVRPASGIFDTGSSATFTVTPNSGYRFINWGTDASGSSNPLNMVINNNKVITANFIKQYTLAVTADPNAGTVNSSGGIYDAGSPINLTATPLFPYAFISWSGTDNDNVNPSIVTMNANKSVTANFKKLTASQPITDRKNMVGGTSTSVSMELTQFEWVQGEISGTFFHVHILDPNGVVVKDLSQFDTTSFSFYVKVPGNYTISLSNTNQLVTAEYSLSYVIYHP